MEKQREVASKVIHYMEAHLSEPLNLEDIAREMGYSKYHLCRVFTREVGCSMHQYLQKRRLTKAAEKLVQGEDAITEIAFDAGYESQQAFTYAFKRLYLVSPQAYRKQRQFEPKQEKISMVYQMAFYNGDRAWKEMLAA